MVWNSAFMEQKEDCRYKNCSSRRNHCYTFNHHSSRSHDITKTWWPLLPQLRILLVNGKGLTSFTSLKILSSGHTSSSFKEACISRGLLDDDTHLHSAMTELAQTSTAARLRSFFITSVICCEPSQPDALLNTFFDDMSEDFVMERRRHRADHTLG